jgi:hypothetical protein
MCVFVRDCVCVFVCVCVRACVRACSRERFPFIAEKAKRMCSQRRRRWRWRRRRQQQQQQQQPWQPRPPLAAWGCAHGARQYAHGAGPGHRHRRPLFASGWAKHDDCNHCGGETEPTERDCAMVRPAVALHGSHGQREGSRDGAVTVSVTATVSGTFTTTVTVKAAGTVTVAVKATVTVVPADLHGWA